MSEGCQVVMWLKNVLEEIEVPQRSTAAYQDHSGTVSWATGPPASDFTRIRHIDIKYHSKTVKLKLSRFTRQK